MTHFEVITGEEQMWHVLAYFSYLPNVKLWSGLLLFASIFILLNIFVSCQSKWNIDELCMIT